ncbi:uncharacterized protein [Littorina saxatilis]|uniref:uncharacterized protein isoform X2 n=1 Tax=Littorina saxatilis TaxID=31220 RepID=UPI0038B4EEA1
MAMQALSLQIWAIAFVGWILQCNADMGTQIGAPTGCINITAVVGQKAAITCQFGRDVSKSKHNIDVQQYPPSSHEPVSMLKCNWLVRKPDEPTCTVHSGCSFNASVNNTLTIEISNVTRNFEGDYFCQLVPSDGIPARACHLTVIDSSQEDQGIARNGTVTSNNDVKLPEGTRTQSNVPAIVLGIIVIILVSVIIGILFLWRRERKIQNSRSKTEIAQAAPESKAMLVENGEASTPLDTGCTPQQSTAVDNMDIIFADDTRQNQCNG